MRAAERCCPLQSMLAGQTGAIRYDEGNGGTRKPWSAYINSTILKEHGAKILFCSHIENILRKFLHLAQILDHLHLSSDAVNLLHGHGYVEVFDCCTEGRGHLHLAHLYG